MTKTGSHSEEQQQTAVHREMTIESILGMFPHKAQRLAQEITNAGLHCIGCHAATWETLEAGMLGHGKTEAEIQHLIDRLNALLSEEVATEEIIITEKAASKYQAILQEEGKDGWGLRFGDKPAGCSGFEYVLDYSQAPLPDDEVFVSQGIEIHVNKDALQRLIGAQIDYVDGLMGSGFKVSNPNVATACGCGSSHGYG